MSLPVLRKLQALVRDGAAVIGERPTDTPSLSDKPADFQQIVNTIWVISGQSLEDALQTLHIPRDFDYTKPEADTNLLFVHRALTDGDLYFVDNRNNRVEVIDASFRVTGKSAELWHADSGAIEPVSYRIDKRNTTVPLKLAPYESVFVVFRHPTTTASRSLPAPVEAPVATITGSWKISFQPNRGAPAEASFDKLQSWSEIQDVGIKYFSGRAIYTKNVEVPANWFKPGAELWLDLGDVKNIAEVKVNGISLPTLWKSPFRVNVTSALKTGSNYVEIAVTNLWVNRLIGDQQPGVTEEYTFTTHNPYKTASPLLPSGLLGPVEVIRTEFPN